MVKTLVARLRKWGNSLGLLIPKEEARNLNLRESQEVVVELVKKDNPLKELFGFGSREKIKRQEFLETRKLLEGRI